MPTDLPRRTFAADPGDEPAFKIVADRLRALGLPRPTWADCVRFAAHLAAGSAEPNALEAVLAVRSRRGGARS